jgi:hypothetical protein
MDKSLLTDRLGNQAVSLLLTGTNMAKKPKDSPFYLDLDAVKPDETIVVKLGGNEHPLKPISIDDFIENTRTIQKLQAAGVGDTSEETEIIIGMLQRAFPSMTRELIGTLDIARMRRLMEFAMEHNGTRESQKEADSAQQENPPRAGR